jgi:general secretion pathway protein B
MSYILDALRRADAERSRGAVPGLHAHNVPADGEPAARNFNPLIWAAGGAGMLLVAVVCILLFGPWKAGTPAASDTRVALAPAPELAPAARDNAPAQPAQGELQPAQPGAIDPGARPIEPPIGRSNPPSAYPPLPVPRTATREPLAERSAAGRVATLEPKANARLPAPPAVEHYGAPMATASAPAPERSNAIVNVNDLPPNVRSQLPRLTVGGAIYSDTPSARMVILNGQVFHEGEKPAADTVLEQIRLKSAVLNFRGQRYEVSF